MQRFNVTTADHPQQRIEITDHAHPHTPAVCADVRNRWHGLQLLLQSGGNGIAEADIDPVEFDIGDLFDRFHRLEFAIAQDAHAVAYRLNFAQDMRRQKHGFALIAIFVHHRVESLLHQRIEAAGRLVQDQELGRMHHGDDEPQFALIARRQVAHAFGRIQVKAFRQFVGMLYDAPRFAADAGDIVDDLVTRAPLPQAELRRKETDALVDFHAVGAEHPGQTSLRRPGLVESGPAASVWLWFCRRRSAPGSRISRPG